MANPKLHAVTTDDELSAAVDEALSKDMPSTRTLIARTKKTLAGSIASLKAEKDRIEKKISDLRLDLRNVDETLGALETASGKLAQAGE